jgi:tRNA (adenine22-N1)-methyltransferase
MSCVTPYIAVFFWFKESKGMNLSARLQAIADAVPGCRKAADIGTDHGYIPLYLIQNRRIEYAVAADISAGSLKKAEELIRDYGLDYCIETRLGSGLSVLTPGEVDTIIVAGMGGLLIRDILDQGQGVSRAASTLVLQPMIAQEELRRWLISNGYGIIDEDLVQEGQRIYEIIVAVPGKKTEMPDKAIYYDIGWKLVEKQHPLLGEFIRKKIQALEEITEQLNAGRSDSAWNRKRELEEKLNQYKEVYHCHIR